jgi:hypothetical protein
MERRHIQKHRLARTLRVLGRVILDLRREQQNAKFEVPTYPGNDELYKLGLAAIGEINKPEVLEILKEASRRDPGIRHVVNDVINNLSAKSSDG